MERHHNNPESFQRYTPQPDDAIDLGQVFVDLLRGWKSIALITIVGTLAAVTIALLLPREYQVRARVSVPDTASIERLKLNSLVDATEASIFRDFTNKLESTLELNRFVTENGFLDKLYPNTELSVDSRLAEIDKRFNISPVIPDSQKREANYIPRSYRLSLSAPNEGIAAELLNGFISHSNEKLLKEIESQNQQIVALRLENIDRQVALLRYDAKTIREREISRKEKENQLKIEQLEQQRMLIIELAASDRQTQLAEVKEALKIATELKIVNPTPIDELSSDSRDVATSIKLTSSQSLPLYLMGTRYLKALSNTLVNRENDGQFIKELNKLNKSIAEAKYDPALEQLKSRTSDDLYIEELPKLLSEQNALKTMNVELTGIQLYSPLRLATVSGKATKPNRVIIVGLGLVLSFLLSIVFVLVKQAVARRD